MLKGNSQEKLLLKEFLKKIDPITELEARFGLEIREFGYQDNKISRKRFSDILEYFKNNIGGMEVTNTLDVFFWENSRNQNSIRTSIKGMDNIQKYCRTDKIEWNSSDVEIISKNKVFWTNEELDDLVNNKKIWKADVRVGNKVMRRDTVVYDSDYYYRIGLKKEIPITYNSSKKQFDIKRGNQKYLNFKEKKSIENELNKFNNLNFAKALKTFRYKRRWQFKSGDGLFSFDLTVVKSSKKNGRFDVPTKTFNTSQVLEQPERYEIEIEYIGSPKEDHDKIMESFYNSVGLMMGKIQDSKVVISKTEKNNVLNEYRELILSHYLNKIDEQLENLERHVYTLESESKPIDKKLIKSIERLKKSKSIYSYYDKDTRISHINNKYPFKRCWIGPKPITLERDNLLEGGLDSIVKDYSVTDKADGERMMLFINLDGYAYFINNNMDVKPVVLNKEKLRLIDYSSVLIDGEFIKYDKKGNDYNRFLAFDIYWGNKKKLLAELKLFSEDSKISNRYSELQKIFNNMLDIYTKENSSSMDSELEDFKSKLWYKTFYFSNSKEDIYTLSKECFEKAKKQPYNIDGLVFTPIKLGVGFNKEMTYDIYLDSDYRFNYLSGSWTKTFKWKPVLEQSIDFYVEIEKNDTGSDKIYHKKIVSPDGTEEIVRYKILKLFVGINQLDKKIKTLGNPCSGVTPIVQSKGSNYITKMLFTPSYFWYEGVGKAMVPISEDNKFQTVENVKNGLIKTDISLTKYVHIPDKSVVEFVYHDKAPEGFKWKVLRVREDKTELLAEANAQRDGMFDSYKRNLDVIKSILKVDDGSKLTNQNKTDLNNISKRWCKLLFKALGIPSYGSYHQRLMKMREILLDGDSLSIKKAENIPIQFNYGNYYITAENVWKAINEPVTEKQLFEKEEIVIEGDVYYQKTGKREQSATFRMQEFHNKYVKKSLIWAAVKEVEDVTKNIKLLDLCCGKGGDLFKWQSANIKKVLGIDFSKDNIYNRNDGACIRYINMHKKSRGGELMDVDFLVGDCGESIKKLEAFTDSRSRDYYSENYLDSKGEPMKFNIVSCQFAIHYFLNSFIRIHQFIDNVDEHLEKGGVFVGTCLDGNIVYDKLCQKYRETGELRLESKDEFNNTIWSIEGKFDCDDRDISREKHPVNFNIGIQLASITGDHFEYDESLVNFGYLTHLFEKRGFKLIANTKNMFPGDSGFEFLYKRWIKKPDVEDNLSESEKELSFMYRCFAFKKL